RVAREVFSIADPSLQVEILLHDGDRVQYGDIALTVSGKAHSILRAERLVLNFMQRMSGIATATALYTEKVSDTNAKITDTRKTTPGMRALEKEAVRTGGGVNHRMGLYDMIMLKDNHIDYAGGIAAAIRRTQEYLSANRLNLKIEVEARNIREVAEILETGGVDRIMLDNFNIPETREAVALIAGRTETESSGGITLENVRDYALCGVDYISIGALTHHIKSLDMSLKAY
ncbi:MAG: carboxylating nicotinate-nucleotide diphosphorylase, partial [Bacteroidales bacterium]|nr:carboxylating nicotinate-nucleotide diphosphorylase [Bacteroidales bacterium]